MGPICRDAHLMPLTGRYMHAGWEARQDCNRFRQGVPLDNCKGGEKNTYNSLWMFAAVGMSWNGVSRDTGIWLGIIRERHCYTTMNNLIEKAKTRISPSQL